MSPTETNEKMLTFILILIAWTILVDWPDRDDPRRHPARHTTGLSAGGGHPDDGRPCADRDPVTREVAA